MALKRRPRIATSGAGADESRHGVPTATDQEVANLRACERRKQVLKVLV